MKETLTDFLESLGQIHDFYSEDINWDGPFIEIAARFADLPGTVVLMSGGSLDCARYHILAAKPWLTIEAGIDTITLRSDQKTNTFNADPLESLKAVIRYFGLKNQNGFISPGDPPVSAGLFGYLSYDLKDSIEKLPRTSINDTMLPHLCFFAPTQLVVHDKKSSTTRLFIPRRAPVNQTSFEKELAFFTRRLNKKSSSQNDFFQNTGEFKSNFTKPDYMDAVKTIREYIKAGDVYQVNMSQRFETGFSGNPFHLFKALYGLNPAPFFAYINAGSHQILSTSPERFLLQTGEKVETRPIKGTRPRGTTPEEDDQFKQELLNSQKDDAELSMIVDLLRNDLGKVCKGGSVKVTGHKSLEAYQNVYHLVSRVEGTLDKGINSVDVIRAAFPGGSITGCPKIRAMEIIDELESCRRHIYTGSIGYISFHDTMDFSIAIRTATVFNNHMFFSMGGGIVYDSNPDDEYAETLHKGQTLLSVFEGKQMDHKKENHVWINGRIKPPDEAVVSVADQGFLYGYGFFETIRVTNGHPAFLNAHISRFNRSWKELFSETPPDVTWKDIIDQVIFKNRLTDSIAAVKIIGTLGDKTTSPFNHTLVVTARPYIHRLTALKKKGIDLAAYPHTRQTPLADHKTLNYLYYLLAGNWAKSIGADEALILNPDQSISETNTANILLINDQTIIRPESVHVLPGVMEERVLKILSGWGYTMKSRKVEIEDLFSAAGVILTNSLMGAAPVLTIDKRELAPSKDLCDGINKELR